MGDTWQSKEAWIFIERPQPFAIGGTTRSSDIHRTVAIIRDHDDARTLLVRPISITIAGISIGWPLIVSISSHYGDVWTSPKRWISIARRRTIVEELHVRSSIEPRSRRNRAAIEEILSWDRPGLLSNRSASDRRSTRTTIDARSRPGRGAIVVKIAAKIVAKIEAKLKPNSS